MISNADGSLSVLLNNGKGVYGTATVIAGASGNGAGNIVVGDFNKDGKLDLAIANWNGFNRDSPARKRRRNIPGSDHYSFAD